MKAGQTIILECQGETAPGKVLLASENGKSLMVFFQGMMIGYISMMPLLMDEAGQYRDLIQGIEVSVKPADPL